MSTPRHRVAPGSSYFVTTRCWQGRAVFQVPEIAQIVVQTLLHYRDQNAYLLHEFVVMPNHLHALLTPSANTSLEKAVQLIKGGSSHAIHSARGHKIEVWQEGFHDWTVRDAADWNAKVEYIRLNPVRSKLVNKPEEWPYCSASCLSTLDAPPPRYLSVTSGAKAPVILAATETPGLKSRPPETDVVAAQTPESKSRAPEDDLAHAAGLKSRPPVLEAVAAVSSDLKVRSPKNLDETLKPCTPKAYRP